MINGLINKLCFYCRLASLMRAGVAALLCVALSSCFKEKPIPMPYIYNGPDVFVANMGPKYDQQLYFNAQTFQFTDSNSHFGYDMAFDCDPTSYNIWINGSKLMFACRTGKYNLADASMADSIGNGWHEELGSGLPAENAIGVWGGPSSNKEVYLLNLGTDIKGQSLGFRKVQMGDCTGDNYVVTWCNLDGSDMHTVTVLRKANRNKVYLSFADAGVKDLEPDYNNWDIIFTRYSIYFPVQNLPYQVTGVLTNPHKSMAYFMDSTSAFDSIKIAGVDQSKFTQSLDNIGYTWKSYGLGTTGQYTWNEKYTYILRSDGRYYKIRFLGFYNAAGDEGYPKFQIDELK
ncbi:MAG: hypothetical protein JWO03_2568 [Bacteroidetes bacterium]|nr:hypothetical protein [Bacteroidota bacterium]